MSTRIFFSFIRLCAVLLIPGVGSVCAQELVSARVLSIQGQVEIQRQPAGQATLQKVTFKVEDSLNAGDTIITGKNGRLVLGLSDGSQAVIAPKTTVVIQNLSSSPRTLFNVIKGKTRVHIEKLGGQPNPYRVNTPTAVIAVRGTIFDVLVEGDETQVFLHEGEVAVTNLRLPDQPVILSAGMMTRISLQSLPHRPSLFKSGRNDGTFKPRDDGRRRDNSRIADGRSRPDSSRVGNRSNDNGWPGSDRIGRQPNSGSQPDFGRGGSPPNNSGSAGSPGGPGSSGPGSNSNSRGGGKRP